MVVNNVVTIERHPILQTTSFQQQHIVVSISCIDKEQQ